jgi:hypothetical protein
VNIEIIIGCIIGAPLGLWFGCWLAGKLHDSNTQTKGGEVKRDFWSTICNSLSISERRKFNKWAWELYIAADAVRSSLPLQEWDRPDIKRLMLAASEPPMMLPVDRHTTVTK